MKDQQAKQQQAAAAAAQQQQQQQQQDEPTQEKPPQEESTKQNAPSEDEVSEEEEEDEESEEEEEESEDEDLEALYQQLVGKKLNKSGMVVDKKSGAILGRLVEGKVKRLAGKKVGENGEILNDKGKVAGRVEPVGQDESSEDDDSDPEDDEDQSEAVKDEAEESVKDATKEAKKSSKKSKKSAEDVADEDVTDNAEDEAKKAKKSSKKSSKKATEEATEDAEDASEEASNDTKKYSVDNPDDVQDAIDDADAASKELKDAKDSTEGDVPEEAPTDAENDAEEAKDDANDIAEAAEDATGDSKDEIEDAADTVKDHVDDVADEAKDATDDATDKDAKDSDNSDSDDEEEEVTDKKEDVKDAADTLESQVEDLEVGGDEAKKAAGETKDDQDSSEDDEDKPTVDEESPVVKKSGKIFDMDDNLVGHVDKRMAAKLAGCKVDPEGNVINDEGEVVGIAEMIQPEEPKEEEKPFNPNEMVDENSPEVKKSGKVVDMEDNIVGSVDKKLAPKLAGFKVDESGNVINNEGHIVAKAEMIKTEEAPAEEEKEEEKPFNPNDMINEDSPEVRKSGKILDMDDNLVGHIDKKLAPKLAGFKVDEEGNVINHEGHIVAKAEMIKTEEPKEEKPTNDMVDEDSPEVKKSGKILDMEDNIVGHLDKRAATKYAGCKVDTEGNVYNSDGHIVAKAEMIKPEEPKEEDPKDENKPFNPNEMVDEDSPEVKKSGKVVDMEDNIVGSVDKRVASKFAGCKVDPEGNVINGEGHIVARADMIKPEEPKEEEDKDKPFNPYAMVDENSPEVKKSGKVVDMDDNIVGTVDKRIASKLAGCKVDNDGNIINSEGHIAGKAEMIKEEEPKEEEDKDKPFNPNTSVNENSPEVRRSGKVVDDEDNVVGHVDKSAAHKLAGFKVDHDGNVINEEGHIVGKAQMIKEKSEEERKKEAEDDEYRRIADLMSGSIQHSLDKIKPVLKQITDTIEAEEAKSESDRDEDKLVETVKPLIEQGSNILSEANGAIRGLDPSGKIAKTAQGRTAERKALPEEYHLAELLSQLTGEVSTTIDKAKKKVKNMPKAKKALSPLWNILQSPLLQILSAVGLLLTGVLGIVGQLLNGLGLGGIINSLLGGIGLNKILEGFGLGNALNLAGKK